MACVNCAKIRAAILHGKMAEAAGLTVDALREKIGMREQSPDSGSIVDARLAKRGNGDPELQRPLDKPIKVKAPQ